MATMRFSDVSGEVIDPGTGGMLGLQFDDVRLGRVGADITYQEAERVLEVLRELGADLDQLRQPAKRTRGPNRQSASLAEIRETFPNAYRPWDDRQDDELVRLFHERRSQAEIAHLLERQPGAISSRLRKLGLIK
jgi:DNA-directed RNA polymerase specialized sigma24 family protein